MSESRIRSLIRGKTRIAAAWIFALVLIYLSKQPPALAGVAVCFIGATIRFWASGYLRKDNRPAIGGPYAFVRNPLYLGTYLMAVGSLLAVGHYVLTAVVTVGYAALYHFIILDEETKLIGIFGKPYETYKSLVPRFFPRPWPAGSAALQAVNPEPAHSRYDWPLSMKNKSYEAYAAFIGLMALIWLSAEFLHRSV